MMVSTQDFGSKLKDIFAASPVDLAALQDAFRSSANLNEKLAAVAIGAAEKSTEISTKWTRETLTRMADISKAKPEPADYAKAVTEFASTQAEGAAEHLAAFAEVAKNVQLETVELMMNAGKDLSDDAARAVKKATGEAAKAAKKAAA